MDKIPFEKFASNLSTNKNTIKLLLIKFFIMNASELQLFVLSTGSSIHGWVINKMQ